MALCHVCKQISQMTSKTVCFYLKGGLHLSITKHIFKTSSAVTYQETVNVLWSSHQHSEIAELFSQGQEHLIFIIDGV